jgi:hypothetical protein
LKKYTQKTTKNTPKKQQKIHPKNNKKYTQKTTKNTPKKQQKFAQRSVYTNAEGMSFLQNILSIFLLTFLHSLLSLS